LELGEKVWRLLLKGFDDNKPTLTFKMISILAAYIISTNPKIKKGIQLTYKYVFLDEFQDTTDLQYLIAKNCFLSSKSILTAVGDNKQRIMIWAGARKTVFKDFENDFGAETQNLLMNHRSAPRLVDLQRRMYASLNENGQAVKSSNRWNPDDGEISLLISQNEQEEAVEVAEIIYKKILSGTEPSNICILCKQRPETYVTKIVSELSQRGVCARIETDYQDLLKEPIVEILSAFLRLAIDIKNPNDWEMLLISMSEMWGIDSCTDNENYYNMQDELGKEIEYLKSMLPIVANKREFHDILKHLIGFLGIDRIKAMFPCYEQGKYINEQLTRYQDLLWKEFEVVESNWIQALENFEGKHSVPIMTIHKSKGLEYEVVCFVGLEDSAFWNFRSQPEEDRCAFFVALSRAKKEVMFTFSHYRDRGRYSYQSHNEINEFFELLQEPGVAKIIKT
jgi:superfamily I DNA/RNA helicase